MTKDQVNEGVEANKTEATEEATESSKMSTKAKVAVWGLGALALTGLVAGGVMLAGRFGGTAAADAASEAADTVTAALRK